ncbi:phosphatase PAP2 family protein [Nakamurella endophytica]|uniref:Phosphatidic acid phosphatase type 2/haloperoxidase domain-containing protein n=1 Tax=Nakamurella endophytica TaxID=1748367 RepID=A0A917SZ95_9ACTN|nr:phosphatase PAP2 family protein [Nakamurella endophytica]GGM03219.1 hypothetical protein GCM10011594_24210 [Nakamurella endophytica]
MNAYGYVWISYAVAAAVLVALGATVLVRRRRGVPGAAEVLVLRGLVLGVLAVVILRLADAAEEDDGLASYDRPVWHWAVDHRSPALTGAFRVVTTVGSTLVMSVLATVAVAVLAARRRWWDAGLVAVVGVGAALLVTVGKHVVGRTRPPVAERLVVETNQSFPSGHALASAAVLGVLVVVLGRWWAPATRLAATVAAVLAVLLIGASRVYLGVHWATDVLGGWLTGAAWLLLCCTVRLVLARRSAVGLPSGGTTPADDARPLPATLRPAADGSLQRDGADIARGGEQARPAGRDRASRAGSRPAGTPGAPAGPPGAAGARDAGPAADASVAAPPGDGPGATPTRDAGAAPVREDGAGAR